MKEQFNKFIATKKPLAVAVLAATGVLSQSALAEVFALEEIVVTAQKRVESLQDVPISVSAVNGDKLSEAGIENLQDLSAYVPNLQVVDGGLVPLMFIRGIGSGANQGFEQSVGTYSDGIYMGRSFQSRGAFMDLERVEVLRGPQSILFGKNSIAGAISLVSAAPSDEFEGKIGLTYTPEYDGTEINGYVTGPLTDNLSARLAIRDRREDGYIHNAFRDEDGPDTKEQSARLSFRWDASENLSALLKYETSELERRGRIGQVIDSGIYPFVDPSFTDDAELNETNWSNEDNRLTLESDNIMLKVEYALGEHTLTSITGHSEYEYFEDNYDGEFSQLQIVQMDMMEDFEQFSQEFRLTSPAGETVDYIVGAFYQTSEQEYHELANLYVATMGMPTPFNSQVDRPFAQETDTWAVFAQATWNINEQLRLTAGLRYTEEEKEGKRSSRLYSLSAPGTLQSEVDLGGLSVADVFGGSPAANGFRLTDHDLSGKRDEEVLTPSVNLQYDLNEDVMIYATFSSGYKAGGFDARGINGATSSNNPYGYTNVLAFGGDNFMFEEEEGETIELGFKMTLLEGTAELNGAFYETAYSDMQVSVYDGTFGFSVLNAGEAKVRGMELDGRWRATENLMVSGGLAYLDFEWTDYTEGVCPGVGYMPSSPSGSGNCDFTGQENQHTPEWTFNLSANHTMTVSDDLELRSTLDANFKDNHFVAGTLDRRHEQPATTIFNMRIELASLEDTWSLAMIGKNLTDEKVMSYGAGLTLSSAPFYPQGGLHAEMKSTRSFAVEGNYRF